jgi:hypothetical protein
MTSRRREPAERANVPPSPPSDCDHRWALYRSTPDIVTLVVEGVPVAFDPARYDLYFCTRDPTHMLAVRRYRALQP